MLGVVWVSLLFYIWYSRQNHEPRIQENKNGKILITVEDQSFFKTYFYCGWNKIEIKHYFAALVSDSDRNHSCFAFYQLFFSHRSTSTQQRSVWRRKIVFNIQQNFPDLDLENICWTCRFIWVKFAERKLIECVQFSINPINPSKV